MNTSSIGTIFATALLSLAGCATIAGGSMQVIAVDSKPSGASCEASRDGMRLHSGITPTSFPVDKSFNAITISCVDAMNRRATMVSRPGAEPWTLGNLLFGGLIGFSIDIITGSIARYDTALAINMGDPPMVDPGHTPPIALSGPGPRVATAAPAQIRRDLLVRVSNATPNVRGVRLLDVLPGGAAADAGLRSGDTITRFNGAAISDTGDMQRELARVAPNTTVATSIWRSDHEMPVNVRF